ncbi:piggybac transposable element-derived protein 4 [Holotrichia oblita]|uniref:Piggybac transposable element-derived protein 4 n=1 Tax=Holotrichia oblita TaxID=644536 RepID=A0ACB9SKB2_HOLOL|nr:piggybac transposable element-derived protein 4 [Holotrichia oblita]
MYLCSMRICMSPYGSGIPVSVTDMECQWARQKPKDRHAEPVETLMNVKPHRSTNRNAIPQEVRKFHQKLLNLGTPVAFTWLLNDEPAVSMDLLPAVDDILFLEEYLDA